MVATKPTFRETSGQKSWQIDIVKGYNIAKHPLFTCRLVNYHVKGERWTRHILVLEPPIYSQVAVINNILVKKLIDE
jgi:hypothetical protein